MSVEDRCFKDKGPLRGIDNAFNHLVACLERVVHDAPPEHKSPKSPLGIWDGPASLAFLFHRLSMLYPELSIDGVLLKDWSLKYLDSAQAYITLQSKDLNCDPVSANDCGVFNNKLSYLAVKVAATGDLEAAKELCNFSSVVAPDDGDGLHEWAVGKAGYLYLLRLAKTGIPAAAAEIHSVMDKAAEKVVKKILMSPRPWLYKGDKEYLGAVHGVISIITQVVLTLPSHAKDVEDDLKRILAFQFENGNWPSSSNKPNYDELVQFCHGSPGFVISLRSLRPYFPKFQPSIDAAITKGIQCTWERGLLRKYPNLCHGISGNALVFDDKDKFEHFLSFTTPDSLKGGVESGLFTRGDRPYGVHTGEAGQAWAWAVADKGLEKRMIGYNDL